jgi:hypothetical protein
MITDYRDKTRGQARQHYCFLSFCCDMLVLIAELIRNQTSSKYAKLVKT